jgi:hypothetical protein
MTKVKFPLISLYKKKYIKRKGKKRRNIYYEISSSLSLDWTLETNKISALLTNHTQSYK